MRHKEGKDNMKLHRFLAMLLAIVLGFGGVLSQRPAIAAEKTTKNYLLLVEQTKGDWIAYDNAVHVTANGKAMVPAQLMARALGFLYEEYTKKVTQFSITKTEFNKNTYSEGDKAYVYQSSKSKSTQKKATSAALNRKNIYYCEVNTLSTLCHVSYFSGDAIKQYKKYGNVDGVYCISNVSKTKSIPNYKKVVTPYSQPWYKTFIDLNKKEPGETELYGVTFKARDRFLQTYETIDDLEGKRFPGYQAMKDKAKEYSEAYRKANKIKDNAIGYQLTVDTNQDFTYEKSTDTYFQAVSIRRERINHEDYWSINFSMQFRDNEADLNALKALCYFISSTPETLYNVITYDLFTESVLPAVPGIRIGREDENLIGILGREYGDFIIFVDEEMATGNSVDKNREYVYPDLPFTYYMGVSYYVKERN